MAGALGAQAEARPARIILLRHGEKKNSAELCGVGTLRAQALAAQYLGKGAPANDTIYGKGVAPDAFFAVTLHTQETAAPSAQSWGKPLTIFSVPPKDPDEDSDLATQTLKAAAALNSAEYAGKTVVVVWEHKHIAHADINGAGDTFWSLLKLGGIPNERAKNLGGRELRLLLDHRLYAIATGVHRRPAAVCGRRLCATSRQPLGRGRGREPVSRVLQELQEPVQSLIFLVSPFIECILFKAKD